MKKLLKATDVNTIEDAINLINQRSIIQIKVATTDIDGILRGKYINKEKFISALQNGFGFCDVIFGWDSKDELYEKDSITGWGTAFPDAHGYIDVTSCRELPMEKNSILFLVDFAKGGKHKDVCPRSLLKKIINQGKQMDITFHAAAEFEFFMFNETQKSIREKNYQNLENFTPDMFGYSMIRNSVHNAFYEDLMELCLDMDMPIEGIHTETGPGVIEAAILYDNLLKSADNAILFKTFTKVLAQKNSLMATFMAKYSNKYPGQSGHLHISATKEGKSIFYDKTKKDTISDEMRYFIGGQQKLMPELLSMIAPTCNSYTRLIPGFWAPTQATWGIDNRTCALRAITGEEKSQRVEYRVTAADINPYIALAAAVGSGLWGIKNKIEPTLPISGNAYEKSLDDKFIFSRDLYSSTQKLKNSSVAREIFGDIFVDHYCITREHESNEQLKAITNWQLDRYFEII